MKKKAKWLLAAVLIACLLCLTGCSGKYASLYNAIGCVHSNTARSAFLNFAIFEGRMAFTLKSSGQLKASAKLGTGSAVVYYDDGEKKELFSLGAGEELDSVFGPFANETVYIIVETSEKCQDGEFRFDME